MNINTKDYAYIFTPKSTIKRSRKGNHILSQLIEILHKPSQASKLSSMEAKEKKKKGRG